MCHTCFAPEHVLGCAKSTLREPTHTREEHVDSTRDPPLYGFVPGQQVLLSIC